MMRIAKGFWSAAAATPLWLDAQRLWLGRTSAKAASPQVKAVSRPPHSKTWLLLQLLMVMILTITTSVHADAPRWEVMADLPVGVFNAAASVSADGRKIIVTGGLTGLAQPTNAVQVYDVETGVWSQPTLLRYPRHSHDQATAADGRVVVCGGTTILPPNEQTGKEAVIELLSPPFDARPTTITLNDGRVRAPTVHALANGQVAIIGGERAAVIDLNRQAIDRSVTLRESRTAHTSAHLPDGRIVVLGGAGRDSIEVVDFAAKTSKLLGTKLPDALDDLGVAVIASNPARLWIIGGQDSRSGWTTDRTWFLNLPTTGKSDLTDGPRLGIDAGIADHVVVDLGDRMVIAGGESERDNHDTELTAAWLVDKRTMAITRLPDMSVPHDDACAVVVNGEVWVIGGFAVQPGPFNVKVPTAVRKVERLVMQR